MREECKGCFMFGGCPGTGRDKAGCLGYETEEARKSKMGDLRIEGRVELLRELAEELSVEAEGFYAEAAVLQGKGEAIHSVSVKLRIKANDIEQERSA